jgi:hypothetical protein
VSFPSYFITKLIKGFASGTHGNTGPDEKDTPADDSAFQTPLAQRPNTDETGTRFLEINRDSAQFGRRFKIDQRIKVDDQGMYVPDYSPDTNSSEEDGRLSGEGLLSATTISSSSDSFHTPPQTATLPPDPRTTGPPPSAGLQAERNRHEQFDAEIAARRTEFIALNSEIEVLQQDTFAGISSGVEGLGWIVVGRGVEWLPHAQVIEGKTKEGILWKNAGLASWAKRYAFKVALVGFALFLLGKSL